MKISIIIRTLNEARHLAELLSTIAQQEIIDPSPEVIVVDSGSTDATLEIAQSHGCHIIHIDRSEFSFGRSLNKGCAAAQGQILVIVSGHCIPVDNLWLHNLCRPIKDGLADYVYGRQLGGAKSHFSESRIYAKYFPSESSIPQKGFYCNNANSALERTIWEIHAFDENLTGLEDMDLAKRLIQAGGRVGYVAEAAVYHLHYESWNRIRRRFEREALALHAIMPEIFLNKRDVARYLVSSILLDCKHARSNGGLQGHLKNIIKYRFWQYWGSFKGNSNHRKLSQRQKERYFYPQ